jgi:hypothetical protein
MNSFLVDPNHKTNPCAFVIIIIRIIKIIRIRTNIIRTMVIDSYEKNPKIKLGNYEMKLKEKK